MKTILVVGGAGYIGSHIVKLLLKEKYRVITFDNLSTGYRHAVLGGEFFLGDLANRDDLRRVFQHYPIDGVMHFASFIQVGESVTHPDKYYQNNFVNTLNLLDIMLEQGVKACLFSSTAAIFGEPLYVPIDEKHPKNPANPYGRTKWMVEQLLNDYDRAYGLRAICLRYFNAAGADPECQLGECHEPETHLIPLVLQTASGRRKSITVFGQEYDTPDGTCIRDYVHIQDLCQAHLLALEQLLHGAPSDVYNLGNGAGFSVREVITSAQQVTQRNITVIYGASRAGDTARLVADATKARQQLGWNPQFADLSTIIQHAWQWELQQLQQKGRG
ncbi:UDP-glucose 4-epimerase GalE [Beggiatoa leptomitoformis]|uniref:UDP-glucose 4-epimerase n=1 Tax=Beggiatoa leptomitoformis TaxID=288004 RepID=A0A2N9YG40_9GAMM|nr:UDP-glucose 4-epimerase GalE [Beggiatoa leptomitoformis]ALG68334.1 UDP-glucose 4-epimerase GalE [Beggiatoa leptomitoformis]AUI69349.1 UDP-glucose 4-epimerase GalE [Beggiatoa leptomitoformis]